jgi:hypothetical protein
MAECQMIILDLLDDYGRVTVPFLVQSMAYHGIEKTDIESAIRCLESRGALRTLPSGQLQRLG